MEAYEKEWIKHNRSNEGVLPALSLHVKATASSRLLAGDLRKQGDGFGHARIKYAFWWVPFVLMSESASLFWLPAHAEVEASLGLEALQFAGFGKH